MNTPSQATASHTHAAVDAVTDSASRLRDNAAPALRELAQGAEDMARHSASAVRDHALHLRDASAGYVRGHPLQTVLIAAGVGATLALLVRMLTHRDGSSH